VAGKRALRAETGALAVDMESHVAARVAARRGLPFAVVRVISDSADEALPPAAQIGMKPDGAWRWARCWPRWPGTRRNCPR
jgi:nucleoside phosphorylase